MYAFFLSHAAGDDQQAVQRFFRDLCEAVRSRLRLDPADPVGYLASTDALIENADEPAGGGTDSAIAASAAFVALYSSYFAISETCGRQWTAFDSRVNAYVESRPRQRRPDLIIPLIWAAPGAVPVPKPVLSGQRGRTDLYPEYSLHGLRTLMSNDRFGNTYESLLEDVAAQIALAWGLRHRLPAPRQRVGDPTTVSAVPADRSRPSVRHVHFVVAAADAPMMNGIGRNKYYGDRFDAWNPYYDEIGSESLVACATTVAQTEKFLGSVAAVDDLLAEVATAKEAGHLVVLLSDAWLIQLGTHAAVFAAFDQSAAEHVCVLAPVAEDDDESNAILEKLKDDTRTTFQNHTRLRNAHLFHFGMIHRRDFEDRLRDFLNDGLHWLQSQGRRGPNGGPGFSPNSWFDGPGPRPV
jgi:FxsC-like protein